MVIKTLLIYQYLNTLVDLLQWLIYMNSVDQFEKISASLIKTEDQFC